MKKIIEKCIQWRNPAFKFDEQVPVGFILEFSFKTLVKLLRGWRVILKGKRPNMLMLDKGVALEYASKIEWSRFVRLGRMVKISALGKGFIKLGNNVSIGDFSRIITSTSLNNLGQGISIGDDVGIGEFAYLGGAAGLEIGRATIVGQYFSCHPENHNFNDVSTDIRHQGVSRKGIKIGENCWIGSKVTILDGVTIGNHCVIAAGSVVTKSMPAYSVIGGVPAKILKTISA